VSNRSGVPDIIACFKGIFLGIECKAADGQVSHLQQWNLEKIAKAGGGSLIVYAKEGAMNDFEAMLQQIEISAMSRNVVE
jgi:Holliday junction resolvase